MDFCFWLIESHSIIKRSKVILDSAIGILDCDVQLIEKLTSL